MERSGCQSREQGCVRPRPSGCLSMAGRGTGPGEAAAEVTLGRGRGLSGQQALLPVYFSKSVFY